MTGSFAADSKILSCRKKESRKKKARIERTIVTECASVLSMLSIELENLVLCPQKINTKPQIATAAVLKFWPRCARTSV